MELNGTNTLVAYFSHKGQNYSNGSIVNLQKGNTEVAAETIAGITGADLFEIVPENTYPNEYKECTDAAMTELRSGSRPRLSSPFWSPMIFPASSCCPSAPMWAAEWVSVRPI